MKGASDMRHNLHIPLHKAVEPLTFTRITFDYGII